MLVYFEIDKSTCILGTKFIKRIIGGNALIEGAAVYMIDYEGQEYQATIIKLHGKSFFNIL
jgi:hypothetical protein